MYDSSNIGPSLRWIVILLAAGVAVAGCQSVTYRGQEPDLDPPPALDDSLLSTQATEAQPAAVPPVAAKSATVKTAPAKLTAKPQAGGMGNRGVERRTPPDSRMSMPVGPAGVAASPMCGAPSELRKSSLPTYTVEPPDILLIDAVKLVPKPPYRIESLDILQIVVVGTLLGQDIAGQFVVDPSGMVDLGPAYGKVSVGGQTIDEATTAIDRHLRRILREPEVSVTLSQSSGQQQVAGEHLIGPDGTINLGTYGSVYVAGLTLAEVKDAVEMQLSKYLQNPRVSVDVFAYNSKVFYIISQGAGFGDQVSRVPITGNETVLDAISQVNGLSRLSSKKIWIARPTPGGVCCDQVMPVNWNEITAGASTATNYQILPGDRVFIAEDKLIAADALITRITAPFERIFGFALLGSQSIQTFNRFPNGGNQGNNFF